ncbi:MAG: type IV secretion system DNA-binding domain-containing protein [Pseudonocardiaceae bacterium]|nr:type IV secretion system DNA-binding domain-containing protein [Pseudonocardiaceae bacterium]
MLTVNLTPAVVAPPDPDRILHALLTHAERVLASYGPFLLPAVVGVAATLALVVSLVRQRRHAALVRGARTVTISLPPDVDPAGGKALWANLLGLLRPRWRRLLAGQPHVAFEYAWTTAGLQLRLWVPGNIPPDLVEAAVEAAWPGARATTGPAGPPLPKVVCSTGGRLRLARPDHYPLRHSHDADPLRALLGAAANVHDGESGCVQILARPVTGRRLAAAYQSAAALRGGGSPRLVVRLLDLLTPGPSRPANSSAVLRDHPERAAEVTAILDKAGHPRWAVEVRYAVATTNATSQPDAAVAARLNGRAHQVASAFALYSGSNHFRRCRLRDVTRALAGRWLGRGFLLSVPELAALAHLPLDAAVPGLQRAGARPVAPPSQVPSPGPDVKPLGAAEVGTGRPVAVRVADARHHVHVLGATGVGKSTLLARMILADAAAGRGAVVIDPKGDLVTDLLPRLPAHVAGRTVLFDPDDQGAPPVLNVLDGPDTDLAVEHLVGIFAKIYKEFWGPRTDDVFRAACLTLTGGRGPVSLADIPRLLGEDAYRRRAVAAVHDPVLRGFWTWYEQLSGAHRSFITAPLLNKLRAFLLRPFVRATLAGDTTTVDMPAVLDGGLCLVRLPKGSLGEDTTRLLGSFLLARVWQTVTHRARTSEHTRRDASVYIDEAHNFLTVPHGLDDMLAEARAYRLSMVLAHQNLAQLDPELRDAISTNARNKIYFTVSPEDAHQLRRHVQPALTEHDLAHLGAYQAATRLVVDNAETPAFTLHTQPLPPSSRGRERMIRMAAHAHHPAEAPSTRRVGRPFPADRRPATTSKESD